VKQRNLDDIYVRHGSRTICLTDLQWEEAYLHISDMMLQSNDPVRTYFGLLEHFHKRLREVGDQHDISGGV
jgi:helix-turn-helix protein